MFFVIIMFILPFCMYYLDTWKRRYEVASRIPGKPMWSFLGTIFKRTSAADFFNRVIDHRRKFGTLSRIWILNEIWLITSDPLIVKNILNNPNVRKSKEYDILKPWLGNGILLSEGDKWNSRRKTISPAFYYKMLENFTSIFEKYTKILMEKFRTEEVVDVTKYLPLFTLDSICETAMGIEINAQRDVDSIYVRAMRNVADICHERMYKAIYRYDFFFNFTKASKTLDKSLKIVYRQAQSVIQQRREQLVELRSDENHNLSDETDRECEEIGQNKKMALLDILLQSLIDGEPLSDKDIEDEVNTFMFAGHDTTSSASGFLLYNIAKYPTVQEKLINEIQDIIGRNKNTEITMIKLNELHYLDLVIKESLRCHTTIPFIPRRICEEIRIDNYHLPANSNIYIDIYSMCHREDLFPNPEQFIPERFEAARSAESINPYAYIPFSTGPRTCIGQKFAVLEMKMIAVKILQNFEIFLANPEEELILAAGIALKTANGIKLRFKERL